MSMKECFSFVLQQDNPYFGQGEYLFIQQLQPFAVPAGSATVPNTHKTDNSKIAKLFGWEEWWLTLCCDHVASSPCTLGGCEHIFCSHCCDDFLGKCCPVCEIPSDVKDAEVDRQLFSLVVLCRKLRVVLSGAVDDGADVNGLSMNGEVEPKPSATTSDLPHSTSHDDHMTGLMTSKTEAKVGYLKRKFKDKVRNNANLPKEASPPKDQSGGKKNSGCQAPSRRRSMPEDQRTLTQFYDYDTDTGGYTSIADADDDDDASGDAPDVPVKKNFQANNTKCASGTGTCTSKQRRRHSVSGADIAVSRKCGKTEKENGSKEMKKHKSAMKESTGSKSTRLRQKSTYIPVADATQLSAEGNTEKSAEVLPKTDENTSSKGKKSSLKRKSAPSDTKGSPLLKTPQTTKSGGRKRSSTPNLVQQRTPTSRSRSGATSASPANSQIDKKNAKGETPLHVAAIKNDIAKVEQLLKKGANPNTRDHAGWTPLHETCNHGFTAIAKLLLDNGALINVPGSENDSPLHDAVTNNRVDCVTLLVARGASLTARNIHGLTPLDCARNEAVREALHTEVENQPEPQQSTETVDSLDYQQPCLMGTSVSRDQKITIQKCASLLQCKMVEEYCPEVTHVITSCNQEGLCPRTIKYLQGVLGGKWIVNMEWVSMCLEFGSRVCEEAFEVTGTNLNPDCRAAYKGRMNRKHQLPPLFDGCQFYFHGNFEYPTPEKEHLIELVKSGGGQVLTREPKPGHFDSFDLTTPYHASQIGALSNCCFYLIHDPGVKYTPIRTKRMVSTPATWIMDCVVKFELLDPPAV